MPDTDLDQELARLADDVRASVPVPGLDKIVARHKQRVVRRRMQIGAVVAVLVVSMAVPLLRNQMVPDPPPATPPPDTLSTEPSLSSVDFADEDHGYAVRTTCASGSHRLCDREFLVSDDGAHWRERPLSKPKGLPSYARERLYALGQDEVVVDWQYGGTRYARMYSDDGGRTWQSVSVPTVVTDTVATIPDGGSLVPTCAALIDGGKQCAERGFSVLLPGSGESALLANRPPLIAMMGGEEQTADGQWWVVGLDPKTNKWGLAISDDDGRTWTTKVLDFRGSIDPYGWSIVSSGGTLYATAIGERFNASNALVAIFRSTDGGHTWDQTWRPVGELPPRRVFYSTVVGRDGTLTINATDGKAYVSHDRGRTFAGTEARYGDYAQWTRIGYLALGSDSGSTADVSEDGVHWRKVKIG